MHISPHLFIEKLPMKRWALPLSLPRSAHTTQVSPAPLQNERKIWGSLEALEEARTRKKMAATELNHEPWRAEEWPWRAETRENTNRIFSYAYAAPPCSDEKNPKPSMGLAYLPVQLRWLKRGRWSMYVSPMDGLGMDL